MRASHHTMLSASPAQVVFGQDMINGVKHTTDWVSVYSKRERNKQENNDRENRARTRHVHQSEDKVLILHNLAKT